MKFKTIDLMRQKKLQKRSEMNLDSTKSRKSLEIELLDLLEEELSKNDSILIEVREVDLPDFVDLLNEKLKQMYDFSQVTGDKFIFYNKEMTF